jgi:hypothetical protein
MTKQAPTDLPARLPGESDEAYNRRVVAILAGDDVRTKTDLRDWTGSFPFHLDRSPETK